MEEPLAPLVAQKKLASPTVAYQTKASRNTSTAVQVDPPPSDPGACSPSVQTPPHPTQQNDAASIRSGPNGTDGRKISCEDIQLVQNLIERCLQMYMDKREVVSTLQYQAKIEPGFTGLVWQKLEEQNPEFFAAYHTRLTVKDQITQFNLLLEQHSGLMAKLRVSTVAAEGQNGEGGGAEVGGDSATGGRGAKSEGHLKAEGDADLLAVQPILPRPPAFPGGPPRGRLLPPYPMAVTPPPQLLPLPGQDASHHPLMHPGAMVHHPMHQHPHMMGPPHPHLSHMHPHHAAAAAAAAYHGMPPPPPPGMLMQHQMRGQGSMPVMGVPPPGHSLSHQRPLHEMAGPPGSFQIPNGYHPHPSMPPGMRLPSAPATDCHMVDAGATNLNGHADAAGDSAQTNTQAREAGGGEEGRAHQQQQQQEEEGEQEGVGVGEAQGRGADGSADGAMFRTPQREKPSRGKRGAPGVMQDGAEGMNASNRSADKMDVEGGESTPSDDDLGFPFSSPNFHDAGASGGAAGGAAGLSPMPPLDISSSPFSAAAAAQLPPSQSHPHSSPSGLPLSRIDSDPDVSFPSGAIHSHRETAMLGSLGHLPRNFSLSDLTADFHGGPSEGLLGLLPNSPPFIHPDSASFLSSPERKDGSTPQDIKPVEL